MKLADMRLGDAVKLLVYAFLTFWAGLVVVGLFLWLF
jgi:hypothetical protein